MKGKTCKVLEISRSKTGKHGGAKLHLVGLDIFSHKKVEDIVSSTKTLDIPEVKKEDFPIVSIEAEFLTVRLKDESTRSDIEVTDVNDLKKITKHLHDGHSLVAVLTTARGMETYDSFKRKYK